MKENLTKRYLNMSESKINEDLPPKLQTALDRLERKPVATKAEVGIALLKELIDSLATSPAGVRLLKSFAPTAYDMVVRGEDPSGLDSEETSGPEIEGGTPVEKSDVKVGDVLKVTEDKHGTSTIAVVGSDMGGRAFYYVPAEGGKIANDARVSHSNMFGRDAKFVKTNVKIKGAIKKFKGYSWFETGIDYVDNQLSNLGEKYSIFAEYKTPEMSAIYDKLEDHNYHKENGEFVSAIINALVANKDTKAIVQKYKAIADDLSF